MAWTFSGAKNLGAIHESSCNCQDSYLVTTGVDKRNKDVLLAAISDGAGSAKSADIGSDIVCLSWARAALTFARSRQKLSSASNEAVSGLVEDIHYTLLAQASKLGIPINDLSSTLVGCIIGEEDMLVVQVGDGALVVENGGEFSVPVWPDDGEYVNTTCFVTNPNYKATIKIGRIRRKVDSVILFSDGLQYLVLDHKSKQPHAPFFRRIVDALPRQSGEAEPTNAWLTQMLASEQVTSRSDDDTAIVVAARRES